MAAQFSIDDAFALEGDEQEAVSDAEPEGWGAKDGHREGGEMTFGPLSFSKPQAHPSPAASASLEHSNLKYQVGARLLHKLIHVVCTPSSVGVVYFPLSRRQLRLFYLVHIGLRTIPPSQSVVQLQSHSYRALNGLVPRHSGEMLALYEHSSTLRNFSILGGFEKSARPVSGISKVDGFEHLLIMFSFCLLFLLYWMLVNVVFLCFFP